MFKSLVRLVKHSAVYGIGHILSRSIGFLLLPIHTNFILPEAYGVAIQMFAYLAIMDIFYNYGINVALLRYYILSNSLEEKKRIFSTAYFSLLVTSVLFSGVVYINSSWVSTIALGSSDYTYLIKLGCGILSFDALALLSFNILRAEEKSLRFVSFKILNVIINFGFNILFIVYLNMGIKGIFVANLIASGFTVFILFTVAFRRIIPQFSWGIWRELVSFGLPYIPSISAVIIMDVIDRFFIREILGNETTGIYGAGYKLGMFMNLFVAAFRFAWHPFFLSTYKEPNAKEIFSRVLTYFMLACSGIFLFISLFINYIVRFKVAGFSLFGPEYWSSVVIVPTIMLSYAFHGAYLNFIIGIYLEKKTKYLPLITGCGAVINVLTNILLIPVWGMMGAAYATLLAYGVMATVLYFYAQRLYRVEYEFGRILQMTIAVAIIFLLDRFIHTPWDVIFKLVLLISYPLLLFVMGFFEKREIDKIKALTRRVVVGNV